MTRTSFLVLALCGLAVLPTRAQVTLDGEVVDFISGEPIPLANVRVRTLTGQVYRRALTDSDGRFRFEVAAGGAYMIRVTRTGYGVTNTPVLDLRTLQANPGDTVRLEVVMSENTFVLAPLTVTGIPRSRSVHLNAFETRRARGMGGHFITRDDIERRAPFYVSDILQDIPGVRVMPVGIQPGRTSSSRQIVMTRTASANCPVQVYVDGILANRPFAGLDDDGNPNAIHGWSLDEIISPSQVEAIEVFQGAASVPPDFMGPYARCGVIAVWTRSGARMRGGG